MGRAVNVYGFRWAMGRAVNVYGVMVFQLSASIFCSPLSTCCLYLCFWSLFTFYVFLCLSLFLFVNGTLCLGSFLPPPQLVCCLFHSIFSCLSFFPCISHSLTLSLSLQHTDTHIHTHKHTDTVHTLSLCLAEKCYLKLRVYGENMFQLSMLKAGGKSCFSSPCSPGVSGVPDTVKWLPHISWWGKHQNCF